MTDAARPWLRTSIGSSSADSITLLGRSLADELMGNVSFGDLTYLLATRNEPTPEQSRMLNAVLVSLADHGLTPTALVARLTYTGAPEALQAAVAAGLLGAGSVFLGPTENAARFLADIIAPLPEDASDTELRVAGANAVVATLERGERVPGIGHPIHREEDPRVPRLYAIARETGTLGPHLRLLQILPKLMADAGARKLPINGAGAAGAALADLGISPSLARGFALIARTAGLLAHLAEEMENPLGPEIFRDISENAHYESPI